MHIPMFLAGCACKSYVYKKICFTFLAYYKKTTFKHIICVGQPEKNSDELIFHFHIKWIPFWKQDFLPCDFVWYDK